MAPAAGCRAPPRLGGPTETRSGRERLSEGRLCVAFGFTSSLPVPTQRPSCCAPGSPLGGSRDAAPPAQLKAKAAPQRARAAAPGASPAPPPAEAERSSRGGQRAAAAGRGDRGLGPGRPFCAPRRPRTLFTFLSQHWSAFLPLIFRLAVFGRGPHKVIKHLAGRSSACSPVVLTPLF